MIPKNIMELKWETDGATDFMDKCPLTLNGLKELFVEDDKKEYKDFLTKNNIKDDINGLFQFLNDEHGWADSEVIERILEEEKDGYWIDFEDYGGKIDGYWKIYKINRNWK